MLVYLVYGQPIVNVSTCTSKVVMIMVKEWLYLAKKKGCSSLFSLGVDWYFLVTVGDLIS
ncbi:hypothetical protein WN51_08314 [Melipona quadrifasciata]|uniref:Uncharacterized protein n=1 Tax=Melipona quadrifasciata TaxID=166423 RepID=A0A0N0BK58_9HYME|nr:hypothetical protein WN51_08314 [Melipona quadrifasciata]